MSEHQPHELGTVAMVKNQHGVWNRAILTIASGGYAWRPGCAETFYHPHCEARPLLVIDPEDDEQTSALFHAADTTLPGFRDRLREMVDPKPEEPTGDRATVRDRDGVLWTKFREERNDQRAFANWENASQKWRFYKDIAVAEVLFEGYTPEAQS